MISIIICSINHVLRTILSRNIKQTIGSIDYEIIVIENELAKHSITKAYNMGANKAKYPYLCFCHEDIIFHTLNWGQLLIDNFRNYNPRLIGVLGCTVKTEAPSSVYIHSSELNRQNQLQRYPDNSVIHCYENPATEKFSLASTIDGMFIACTWKSWNETRFSENYLQGFHGYDIDFSLKNASKGSLIIIYDVLIEHSSFGNFNLAWIEAQLLITKRWAGHLPLTTGKVAKQDLVRAEKSNLEAFLKILIKNNCRKGIILKYFIDLMRISPFNPLNIFFLRKLILGNKIDSILKKLVHR